MLSWLEGLDRNFIRESARGPIRAGDSMVVFALFRQTLTIVQVIGGLVISVSAALVAASRIVGFQYLNEPSSITGFLLNSPLCSS
jgi:hypothetical protein